MRWLRIRRAKIDPALREMFERYGVVSMQVALGANGVIRYQGREVSGEKLGDDLLPWLTEQYDIQERKDTWSLVMEVSVSTFVLVELIVDLLTFLHIGT